MGLSSKIRTRILVIISSSVIIIPLIHIFYTQREINNNGAETFGIITKFYTIRITRDFIRYEFLVDGKTYVGDQEYAPHLDVTDIIQIGDTCFVAYAKKNPEWHRLVKREKGRLVYKPRKME